MQLTQREVGSEHVGQEAISPLDFDGSSVPKEHIIVIQELSELL